MTLSIVKVGLDAKKPTQSLVSYDAKTNITVTTVTEYWLVEWSGSQTDPTADYGASAGGKKIPAINDSYLGSSDPNAPSVFRVLPLIDVASAYKLHRVQVDYSNAPVAGNSGAWDVSISIDGVPVTEPYYFDLDDNQVSNSAGQNFSNQPAKTHSDESIRISYKTRSYDGAQAAALEDQVNLRDLTINLPSLSFNRTFPTASLLLNKVSTSTTVGAGKLSYWQVSIDLTHRPLANIPSNCVDPTGSPNTQSSGQISTLEYRIVTDEGFAYLDSKTGKLTPFQDKDKNPLNAPGLLNGKGGAVFENGTAPTQGPNNAYFIAFRECERGDFTPLFFGLS